MNWAFFDAAACFADFRKDWDALNLARSNNHILLDARFVELLLRHFGSGDIVMAASAEGPNKGLALLQRTGMGSWSTFQPSQSPLGLVLSLHDGDGYDGLIQLVRALPGYTVLLSILHQDPAYSSFSSIQTRTNVEILPYIDTPRLQLSGNFSDYWQARSKNLKHNLDRQNRRIREQGRSLELIVQNHHGCMSECVREYGRLESAGWKAAGGTAVQENTAQGRFYRDILEEFSRTGEAVVFQLVLDGAVVASDLCLCRDGMLVVLKTTYDETIEKLSPALLMRREIMRYLHDTGHIRVVEFYGPLRDWHTQWMSDKRRMFHLNVFRHFYMIKTREFLKRFR